MGYAVAGKFSATEIRLDFGCPRAVRSRAIVSPPQSDPTPLPAPNLSTMPALSLSKWFAEEVQPHESSLRSYLRNAFPSLPDIDDFVQESYARLIRAHAGGRVSYAKAFLFTTARNAALDFFRRRKVVAFEPIDEPAELAVIEERPDAADAMNKQQELELLASAVRELPDRCRQVLTLRLMYAYSHKQIAAELRISEHTVKAQLAKGMRRCAEFLAERGVGGAATLERNGEP
jgi:RNA polymerase sigma-70 factor (ECF subfamily)